MNAELFKPYIVHTLEEIRGFFGPYRFLSNFHECTVCYQDMIFPNAEAAYQSAKTIHKNEKEMFTTMTGAEAKAAGKMITLRPDWEQVKDIVMFEVLASKFFINDELNDALAATGNAHLEERNWWGYKYWGVSFIGSDYDKKKLTGYNQLGKILMMIRTITHVAVE